MATRQPEKQDVDRDGRKETRSVTRRNDGTYGKGPRPRVRAGKGKRK